MKKLKADNRTGNNMYVFPGIGLGTILSKAVNVSQDMIYASAEALSTSLNKAELADGLLYPDINRIREVSVIVARGVIRAAQAGKLDRELALRDLTDEQLDAFIESRMYDPKAQKHLAEQEVRVLTGAGVNGSATNGDAGLKEKTIFEIETGLHGRPTGLHSLRCVAFAWLRLHAVASSRNTNSIARRAFPFIQEPIFLSVERLRRGVCANAGLKILWPFLKDLSPRLSLRLRSGTAGTVTKRATGHTLGMLYRCTANGSLQLKLSHGTMFYYLNSMVWYLDKHCTATISSLEEITLSR